MADLLQTQNKENAEKQERAAKELSAKLERILIEQAEVKARLEARNRDQGRPFGEDQSWPGLPSPYVLRARTGCLMLSPIVREARSAEVRRL